MLYLFPTNDIALEIVGRLNNIQPDNGIKAIIEPFLKKARDKSFEKITKHYAIPIDQFTIDLDLVQLNFLGQTSHFNFITGDAERTINVSQVLKKTGGLQEGMRLLLIPFVKDVCDALINSKLKWINTPLSGIEDIIDDLFVTSDLNDIPAGRIFYNEVLEEAISKIEEWVNSLIPKETWNIWYTSYMGTTLILESDIDYRIKDWTTRFEAGEFTL